MAEMKTYKYLIFDADHTLLDYIADELSAFSALYRELGIPVTDELMALSRATSERVWTEAGLYDVHSERIQREYHRLYRSHVAGIFEYLFSVYPCDVDPNYAAERFLALLARSGNLFDGAKTLLEKLSEKTGGRYRICIATNGLSYIQNGRAKELLPYVEKLFVSEELGNIKPLSAFFEKLLAELGAKKEECLMIGDSLSSDVAGANAVGMDSCWYNPKGVENGTENKPTFEVRSFAGLAEILL